MTGLLDELKFRDGLINAVIQEAEGPVLVLCYMDRSALEQTLRSGLVHVYRRSLGRMMMKGETSGHTQRLIELRVDCEGNSVLLKVQQRVAACHAGYGTCYYRRYRPEADILEVCEEKVFDPDQVYRG